MGLSKLLVLATLVASFCNAQDAVLSEDNQVTSRVLHHVGIVLIK